MTAVITASLLVLLSAAVILLMCRQTNKEIRKASSSLTIQKTENTDADPEKETETETDLQEEAVPIDPYTFTTRYIVIGVVLLVLSGIAGFRVAVTANSAVALTELCASYLAVLGAAVIDYKLHIIPNYIPISLVAVRLLCLVYEFFFTTQALEYLLSSLLGGILCFVLLMIAGKLSKGGIGKGDVKLITALGFTCGLMKVFTSLLISLVICVVVSLLMVFLKKKTFKDHMPFGPFIYAGFLIVLIFSLS